MSLSYDLLVIGPGMAGVTAADKCVAEGACRQSRRATLRRHVCPARLRPEIDPAPWC